MQNKLEFIENFALENKIDIIAINEIHDKFAPPDSKHNTVFILPGFTTLQDDEGRGVCLFIRSDLKITKLDNINSLFSPSMFCRVHTTNEEHFVFGVVYRSPNCTYQDSLKLHEQIRCISEKAISCNEKLIIVGDLNYKEINWEELTCNCLDNHLASKFLSTVTENFLTQFVQEATHTRGTQEPTLIDLIIANDHEFISNLVHNVPFGKSHHDVLTFSVNISTEPIKPVIQEKFNLKKGNYEDMRKFMKDVNWQAELQGCIDVDSCWDKIEGKIQKAYTMFIPKMKTNTNKVKRNFTAPDSLLSLLSLKRKAFKLYKTYKTASNYEAYVVLRNKVNTEVKEAKKLKEIRIAKDAKTNPKSLFRYISAKTKPRETIPDLKKKDGGYTSGDKQKAEVLNSFFGSVFTKENNGDLPECNYPVDHTLSHVDITEADISKVLSTLNPGKSPGPDCIHPRVLRELAYELSTPLKILFDKTMSHGTIPSKWKTAEVRPIFKKGDKASPDNYRPVSLTSVLCKVFEKFVRDAMYKHLIDNKILSPDQFGFCQGRSCVTQLLVTANDWLLSLDNKSPVDAIYLDFSKAFDSVPHRRLIHKLNSYGIRGNMLNWVSDFLSNRTQYVTINGEQSTAIPVTSGVPQGSVLGPTLFIYYINDMPNSTESLVRLFADDSKAYSEIKTEEDYIQLQKGINDLVDWSNTWLMNFNAKKCKVMHLGKNNPNYVYTMKDGDATRELETSECEKDLGVNIDPLLDFNKHKKHLQQGESSIRYAGKKSHIQML